MRIKRLRAGDATRLALAAIAMAGLWDASSAHAQAVRASAGEAGAGSSLAAALDQTRTKGVPTVAIITADDQPASVELWRTFSAGAWAQSNRGLIQVVNVSREREPSLVRSMQVRQYPTVAVYRKAGDRVGLAASMVDCATAEALAARIDSLDLGLSPAKVDPAVKMAGFHGEIYPSQQYSQPVAAPPQQAPPQQAPPAMAPPAQTTTMMIAPVTTAGLIQVPSQNFVIQQQAPQIFMAPAQAPVVYMPQTMAPVAAPTANLFMPSAPAAPTMAAPVMATAPVAAPVMAAPVMAAPTAAAAAPVAAVTNNTLSMPTSRASTRVRVRGPGMLGSSLARLGERLTQFGRAKIETVHETTLESPFIQSAGGGLTTISSTTAAPVAPPQTTTFSIPQQAPPQQSPPRQAPPTGSPQLPSSSHGHSLFHH